MVFKQGLRGTTPWDNYAFMSVFKCLIEQTIFVVYKTKVGNCFEIILFVFCDNKISTNIKSIDRLVE
jgi:hypothetical protein